MKIVSSIIHWILTISLRWKLLIPFLFLSFVGTTVIVYIGLKSQETLIKKQEKKELERIYQIFLTVIDHREVQALSIAIMVASNPVAKSSLAEMNRESLISTFMPIYEELEREFGIGQFHFHIPPARSFLRLHLPGESGEMISYRSEVMEAIKSGKTVSGPEWGLTGLAIRSVAPVFDGDTLVGTIEIGFRFDAPFLEQIKKQWQADFALYEKGGKEIYVPLASTTDWWKLYNPFPLEHDPQEDAPVILVAPAQATDKSILLGPVTDYRGDMVALVQIESDRSAIMSRLQRTRNLMLLVGGIGMFLSFALTCLIAHLFIRPIKEIVRSAREIAQGERENRLKLRPLDEMGILTLSLNTMLDALQQRRREIAAYAHTLERMVEERTGDLVLSEEKYRTLVEHIPLIVYRLLNGGTPVFINPYFTEKLGYSIEEAMADREFWLEKICGKGTGEGNKVPEQCWEEGAELHIERIVHSKKGEELVFIDHAIPALDENGRVKWIDGTMVDITELKRLQERTLQTEQIKLLGEISARFAHEIRNPLTIVGGFARRLYKSLSPEYPSYRFAQIILEEVGRLEDILQIIISSIEPFTLNVNKVDLNKTLADCLEGLKESIILRHLHIETFFDQAIKPLEGDVDLLQRAFECMLKHAIISSPKHETLIVRTKKKNGNCIVMISQRAESLAEDDLEQFFFPRILGKVSSDIKELPLAKIIVHRHAGRVTVERESEDRILLRIELPQVLPKLRGARREDNLSNA